MLIGVPRELLDNESRVAATPKTVQQILKLGFEVIVEHNAGFKASFEDNAFVEAGAKIGDQKAVWNADLIFKVNPPTDDEIALIKEGATLVSFIWPAQRPDLMEKLSAKKINVLAMDAVPRISRAQALDALSSMANIAGYRAVVEAAHEFGSFFTGQITAAGKVPPAKVLVIGAGVAGLAAIGAANSLGAIVRAFDSRPEVKEQVESMGASFLTWDIAFQRWYVKTNSGTSGKGKGGAINTKKTDWNKVIIAPPTGYKVDAIGTLNGWDVVKNVETKKEGTFSQEASLYVTYISGGKYKNRNEVYLLKTAKGKFVKIQFYDYVNERLKGGYPSFRYKLSDNENF